jgi:NADH-quinone oxidoreductase chain I
MVSYFKEIMVGFYSLLAGMAVTIRYFFKPIVTVQYPREKIIMTPRYRGHTQLALDAESGTHTCIACELCARTCPSQLITVKGVKVDAKKKVPWQYIIEYQYCSLCGLCIEVCPTKALEWSGEYRLANFSRQESVFDLLTRLQHQQRMAGVAVTPIPEPPAETEGAPEGEVKE